ncbi:hypothetical protein [Desulfogranum mediterraneum]|uniref:hypothetical protein n=1 Tax=Desulfogranum mediterraneum TaxID=160661 RepID=UPI0012947338|nr:hypothetical protein [Desulfogranum mediterraneum]
MAAQYVSAWKLLQLKPNADCCDCGKEVDGSLEEGIWTIWSNKLIYCPKCASYEGIGPND